MPHILGIDPGFAACGIAVYDVAAEDVPLLDVIRTEKSSKKRGVLASDDNLRRAREICEALVEVVDRFDVVVICAESMSFPRNSSAAAKVAMAWGVLGTISSIRGIPIVQASPQEIKKTLCGRKDASKDEIEDAVRARYSGARVRDGVPQSFHNHSWDALSAIAAGMNSEVVRLAIKMHGGYPR